MRCTVVGVDASAGMLDQARAKPWPAGVRFEVGLAEETAWSRKLWGLDGPLHGVFAAYLFRNVTDRDEVLAGLFDLLADDGVLVVQEYSVAGSRRWSQLVWIAVCWLVVIPLGWLTSRQTRLYRYLWRSVLPFDSVQTFVDRLYGAGFVDVEVRTAPGWQRGILHTFRARKPAAVFMIIGRRTPRWRPGAGCSRRTPSGATRRGPTRRRFPAGRRGRRWHCRHRGRGGTGRARRASDHDRAA